MKILNLITGILLTVAYLLFYGNDTGLNLAIAPFVIPAITTGLTALGNLFSGTDRKEFTKEDFLKYGYKDFDPVKAKGDLARILASRRRSKSAAVETKNNQQGLNNPTDVYSNEAGLEEAGIQANTAIDEQDRQEENAIASTLFQANAGEPDEESDFEKLFSGGLIGAGLGFQLGDILNKEAVVDNNNDDPGLGDKLKLSGSGLSGLSGKVNSGRGTSPSRTISNDNLSNLADIIGGQRGKKKLGVSTSKNDY